MRWLVAVSGGVDSMSVLHWSHTNHFAHGVVHINHMLRDAADDDEALVREIAAEYGIPVYCLKVDVAEYCSINKVSIEDGARTIRRKFFEEVMEEYNYDFLVMGQHADDQAETVLNNILRGPSIRGLAGMQMKDDIRKIYRPFLNKTKSEIYDYATCHNLRWAEDHTNQETDYDRCWLRNSVIPELETRRPVRAVLAQKATHFQQMVDFINGMTQTWITDNWVPRHHGYGCLKSSFLELHPIMRGEILGYLWDMVHGSRHGFTEKLVDEVIRWLESNPEGGTKVYFGPAQYLTLRKHVIYVL